MSISYGTMLNMGNIITFKMKPGTADEVRKRAEKTMVPWLMEQKGVDRVSLIKVSDTEIVGVVIVVSLIWDDKPHVFPSRKEVEEHFQQMIGDLLTAPPSFTEGAEITHIEAKPRLPVHPLFAAFNSEDGTFPSLILNFKIKPGSAKKVIGRVSGNSWRWLMGQEDFDSLSLVKVSDTQIVGVVMWNNKPLIDASRKEVEEHFQQMIGDLLTAPPSFTEGAQVVNIVNARSLPIKDFYYPWRLR